MPQAIAAIAAVSALTWVRIAITIASVLYSRQQAKKAKRALKRLTDLSAEAQERRLTALDPIAPRRLIYGEVEVGGTIIFRHTNGDNREYRHLVIIMADHEVTSFSNLKMGGEVIPLNGSGEATGRFAGFLEAQFFLGSPSQTSNAALMANCPEVWTSNHRLRGCAGVYVRMKYNPALFPNSQPDFTALCRGKKIFDPRTALTTWTDNAALCLLDFLTDTKLGMGIDYSSRIVAEEVIASANNCDELIELSDATFEKRYALNGTVTTDTVYQDVIDDMLEAMAGKQIDPGGKISIISGYYRTPTTTFGLDEIRGELSFSAKASRAENHNAVKGTFISPANFWQASEFPPVTNSTYETQDGNTRIYRDMQFMFVTSPSQCQRLAKIALEKIRQPITVQWPGKLSCLRAQVGDVVGLTVADVGWEDKPFEIVNIETSIDAESGILPDFTLRETASSVYDWNDGEETTIDLAPNTTLPSPFDIEPPTNLAVLADNTTRIEVLSGVFVTRVAVTWTAPADEFVRAAGVIEMEWKLFGTTAWIPSIPVPGDKEITYIENPIEAQSYVVRIRSKNRLGVPSDWVYSDPTTSTGDSTPPDEPEDLAAAGGIGGVYYEWTNPADVDFARTELYFSSTITPAPSGGSTAHVTVDGPSDTYFHGGLSPGTTEFGWIRAVDTSGNKSAWVGPVSGTAAAEISASAFPTYIYALESGSQNTSTGTTTCTPIGGVPTYGYLWSRVSGDSTSRINANTPTAATTYFNGNAPTSVGGSFAAVWKCTVTDSSGTIIDTNEVVIEIDFQLE